MKKIDSNNKICIYLDQFAVSDIIDEETLIWKEIKVLLEDCYKRNLVYCPLSAQHFFETVKKDMPAAKMHHEYFYALSDGYFFKNELLLTTQLISSLLRGNNLTLKTFLEIPVYKDFEEIYLKINQVNNVFDESLAHRLSPQNELRKILNPKIEQKTEQQFMDAITAMETQHFVVRLEEYINQKKIFIRPDNYGKHDFPNWIDQLLYILTYTHAFKENDFKKLLAEFRRSGFERIPPLNIRFKLGAWLCVKNKQENAGDHIDIMRIANSLYSSDVMFTDKKRKHEIQSLGLDKKYGTLVFSGVHNDLKEFKSYLMGLAENP